MLPSAEMTKKKPIVFPELPTRVPHRLCWECQFVHFIPGDHGYSEATPGYRMKLECQKEYWMFDAEGDELGTLRRCLTMAETCGDFKEHK